ncbi:MAG: type II secretion system GspH family protein [Defluviitaleaceae bacterium]|nr:type II secretion system GspH family protein [Defluviitaleaceae bacterium]
MKRSKGLTLLEATIALALWLVLSTGVFLTWHHITQASVALRARQNAFENARVAMDALIMNMQMSWDIELINDSDGILRQLTLYERDPLGGVHPYRFNFDASLPEEAIRHHRLEFGDNEFAANIAVIRITYIAGSRMNIFIETGCYPQSGRITLEASVDVRHKNVTVYPRP